MMRTRLTLKDFLKKYPVVSKITVKWGDMDAYQHVNNTVYFKYQEVSRLKYFAHMMEYTDPVEFNRKGFMGGNAIGPILSDTYCAFKFPLTAPDKLLVGATVASEDIAKDRYKISHSVWSLKHQRIVADGFGTVVSYDFKNQKACNVPEILLDAIKSVQETDSLHLHDGIVASKDIEDEF